MELFCYQSECGDALLIRYIGNDGSPHNIFLDSGYERTFRHILRHEINSLFHAGESIDLWIVSHIHDDHIGGVMQYIKSVNNNKIADITKDWLYNPPRWYNSKSIRQGDTLYNFLLGDNKLPASDITSSKTLELFGLKATILSPTPQVLEELREKYKDERELEKNESDSFVQIKSADFDYHRPLESFDISTFNEDTSLENRSSISALFEYNNRKILWLADSHPTDISNSLLQMGYSPDTPLQCDYVIVSHHASKGNNSSELYNIIKCPNYIISADGENRHCLPTKEALSRIIRNKYRDLNSPYTLYFTHATSNLKRIFSSDDDTIYRKWNFRPIFSTEKSIHITLG